MLRSDVCDYNDAYIVIVIVIVLILLLKELLRLVLRKEIETK